jgi:glycosyltransferase involved in cell wall biosynthesis
MTDTHKRQNRIKILFVVNNLKRRGAEQQLFNFIKDMPNHIEPHIFKFSDDDTEFHEFEHNDRVMVYSNRFQGTYNILKVWPIFLCLARGKYDVVVTVGLGAALLLGRFCASICGQRIIYSILNTYKNFNRIPKKQGEYFDILNTQLNRFGFLWPLKRILRFLPNSSNLAAKIDLNGSDYAVETLYNGYSKKEFERIFEVKPNENIQQIYRKFEGYPTVVQVGALDQNKNQKFTVECLPDITKKIANLRLLVIGEGDRINKLKKLALEKGLGKNVIFAGQVGRADCMHLMRKADLLVLTSKSESFPNVLAEGQALGLPVVTFDVGAASEIVENGITGYVIPKGNSKQFTQKVVELLKDKNLGAQMGKNGRKRIFGQYSMEIKVKKFIEILNQDLKAINKFGLN